MIDKVVILKGQEEYTDFKYAIKYINCRRVKLSNNERYEGYMRGDFKSRTKDVYEKSELIKIYPEDELWEAC